MNPPLKSRLLTRVLYVLLAIPVSTPFALCAIFFLGKVYGTVAFTTCLLLMSVLTWFSRKRGLSEAKRIRRMDKAMGKPSDDPRQMARFVP